MASATIFANSDEQKSPSETKGGNKIYTLDVPSYEAIGHFVSVMKLTKYRPAPRQMYCSGHANYDECSSLLTEGKPIPSDHAFFVFNNRSKGATTIGIYDKNKNEILAYLVLRPDNYDEYNRCYNYCESSSEELSIRILNLRGRPTGIFEVSKDELHSELLPEVENQEYDTVPMDSSGFQRCWEDSWIFRDNCRPPVILIDLNHGFSRSKIDPNLLMNNWPQIH